MRRGGGLAGAVRTQQRILLAARDGQVEAVDGRTDKLFAQASDRQGRRRHRHVGLQPASSVAARTSVTASLFFRIP